MHLNLRLKLLSDATFSRGDGVAGLIDAEIEYETGTGLPFVRGRTLKGLLVEECANIMYALQGMRESELQIAAHFLFGEPGSTLGTAAQMRVGRAQMPSELRDAIIYSLEDRKNPLTTAQVLESLTTIRRQTAVDTATGAPEQTSLRSLRAVVRETQFVARLSFPNVTDESGLDSAAKGLLAACVLGLRRGGLGRNRGSGRLQATLHQPNGDDITTSYVAHFEQLIGGTGQ